MKIAVLSKAADRLKVALAETEQTNVAADHVGVGDRPLLQWRDLEQSLRYAGKAVKAEAHQGHAGVGCVEFVVGFLNVETFHEIHPSSELLTG